MCRRERVWRGSDDRLQVSDIYMCMYNDTTVNRIEMSEWDKLVKSLWYWIPRVRDDDVDGEVGGEGRCRKLIIIRMKYF